MVVGRLVPPPPDVTPRGVALPFATVVMIVEVQAHTTEATLARGADGLALEFVAQRDRVPRAGVALWHCHPAAVVQLVASHRVERGGHAAE